MNPLHLIWIIPLTTLFGYCLGAIMATGAMADEQPNNAPSDVVELPQKENNHV